MWVVKFSFDGSKVFFGEASKKFKLTLTGYPISNYEKKELFYVNIVGTISGNLKNVSEITQFLKKSGYVKHFEIQNDFLIMQIIDDPNFKPFYSPNFIYASPVIIKNGFYHYHLASWNRGDIEGLLRFVRKNYKIKLESIKNEKIKNISLIGLQPNLTKKQKDAYELAVKNGYYNYPKSIELKALAKISRISYSTYQQHLKYAEKKISEHFMVKN